MKYARKRWLAMVAVCLGLASPARSELVIVPDDGQFGSDNHFEFSDDTGAIRLGQSASGSVRQAQAEFPPPPTVAGMSPDRVLGPVQPMYEDVGVPADGGVGFANMNAVNQIYWRLGRVNMDQYGFNGGYTNFNAFVPLFGSPNDVLGFINPRLNVTDYGMAGANLGGGLRKYDPVRDRVYGASFWWDYDDGHSRAFSQMGGSFESIGNYFSLRGNFTLPVGTKDNKFGVQNVPGGTSFVGSNISILQSFQREVAMEQYDIEAAIPMPVIGRAGFDVGFGAYVLNNPESGSATGASLRTQAQVNENFWLNGIYTYDHIFQSNFSLNFEMTMPNGRAARWFRRAPVQSYMTQSVQRRYRVPVEKTTGNQTVLATKNGVVINVAFIDPNANVDPSSFDSVFDFNTDPNKADYQLIYVLSRTDDTDTNLNTGISLVDNQILVGQGLNRSITTDQGSVGLPSSSGPAPILSNSGLVGPDLLNPIVTLANNNEVVGFRIDGGNTADGISGNAIESFNIHDNVIENVINGINIATNTSSGSSYGIIKDNIIDGNTNTDNFYPSLSGITVVHAGDGTLDLLIEGNTVRNIDEDANQNGMLNDETTAGVDQDFDGVIDADEDVNGNGVRDGVGIRVVVEQGHINANAPRADGSLTGILNNTVLASASGIEATVKPGPGLSASMDLAMNGNSVTNLTAPVADGGAAFRITSDNTDGVSSEMNLYSFQNNSTSNNAGHGLVLETIANGDLNFLGSPTFLNNTLTGNAGTGLLFNIVDSQIEIDSLSGLNITGNTGDGLAINVTGPTGELTVLNPIVGATITGNGGNGLVVTADDGAVVNMYFGYQSGGITSGNNFSNNGTAIDPENGNGLVLRATNNGTINTAVVGNTFNNNAGNGLLLDTQTGGLIDMTGRTFTQTDGAIWASNGVVGSVSGSTRSQTFNGNGLNGMSILASNGGEVFIPFMNGNSFNDNTQAGLHIGSIGGLIAPADSDVTIDSAVDNLFNRTTSGTSGILFNTHNVDITLTNLLRNQFIGGNGNTAFGIGGVVNGGGLNMELVTPNNADRNVFSNNVGAHVGVIFQGDANSTVNITNGVFTNATADTNAADDFNGDGVALINKDTAILTGSIRNSTFTGNAGDGIKLALGGANAVSAATNFAQLNNFVIDSNIVGTTAAGQGNGLNGINISRDINGNINNLTISRNNVQGNAGATNGSAGAGLAVTSANADESLVGYDTFYAWGNIFSNNRIGIELKVMGDADMIANLGFSAATAPANATTAQRNYIENNTLDGILAWEQVNSIGDTRSISGTWTNNVIRNNGDDGIDFRTNAGDPINGVGTGLVIGAGLSDPTIFGTTANNTNIISFNGRDGIDITGGGKYTIINNYILSNGQVAQQATPGGANYYLGMAGVNINGSVWETGGSPASSPLTTDTNIYQDVTLTSNVIQGNNGDGVQWIVEPSYDASPFLHASQLVMTRNAVNSNQGRGIDMLIRPGDQDTTDSDNTDPDQNRIQNIIGSGYTNIANSTYISAIADIRNNQIAGNLQEGAYLVATNATSQSAAVRSSTALSQNGAVNASYFLNFNFEGNQVAGNGNAVTSFPATGLVMRVGTTGGGYGYTSTGGFASDGAGNATAGGIIATINSNIFSGNQGDDVLVHSFTSTVDPATTGGTWTTPLTGTTTFTPSGFQGDPLARLDLIFNNNRFDSVTFNNQNTALTPDGEAGAFYNNAEGTFKSRTDTAGTADQEGPFNSTNGATRRRNATRLASRWSTAPTPLAPNPPLLNTHPEFLFAGMGNSTFRVQATGNATNGGTALALADLFALDLPQLFNDPLLIDASGEAQGVGFTGTNIFGELPFGWGTF